MKKGTLIQDLLKEKILLLSEDGCLEDEIKIEGVTQSMAFVRFIVREKSRMEFGQTFMMSAGKIPRCRIALFGIIVLWEGKKSWII